MEENKQNKTRQEKPELTESRQAKRSVSCNGRTTPDIWDNCTSARSARGDDCLDAEAQQTPEVRSDTRKRKYSIHTTPVSEKKPKSERPSLAPLTFTESPEEKGAHFADHTDLSQGDGTASLREFPAQECIVVMSAKSSKPATTDTASQTVKSPLVPVSPVISFYEPLPPEPASLDVSYFGAGARLEDGTLRPPPVICAPGTCASEVASPKIEEPKPVVKEWLREKKEPTPKVKKDVTPDEDPKKKKNEKDKDRYLNMF